MTTFDIEVYVIVTAHDTIHLLCIYIYIYYIYNIYIYIYSIYYGENISISTLVAGWLDIILNL